MTHDQFTRNRNTVFDEGTYINTFKYYSGLVRVLFSKLPLFIAFKIFVFFTRVHLFGGLIVFYFLFQNHPT